MFSFSKYSLSTKVIISLFIFILFFIMIRFSLIIPKLQKESFNNKVENVTNSLSLIKNQFNVTSEFIGFQLRYEQSLIKEKLAHELNKIKLLSNSFSKEELKKELNKNEIFDKCLFNIGDDKSSLNSKNNLFKENDFNIVDKWQRVDIDPIDSSNDLIFYYNTLFKPNLLLSAFCEEPNINPGHGPLKVDLRAKIRDSFSSFSHDDNEKFYFFEVKKSLLNEDSRPLYEADGNLRKQRYWVTDMSSTDDLSLGDLSAKQINDNADKEPIEHLIDGIEYFTWIVDITISKHKDPFFISYSIKKEDLLKINNINHFILLPETLISVSIAFVIVLIILKKLFKNINKLTKTAIKVNKGNKKIRSKVKGDDDVGELGEAFDSMLDYFENSIKTLDLKVEEKTKEISKSLEEKEVLLKEIHHRVKNNLAITITLIEVQEEDVQDEKIRKSLVDIKERIFTMELLHRKLYESENLSKICFNDYVKDLVNSIAYSYDIEEKVIIEVKAEEINLNIETAMHYGLILNELVTNAFKHALKNMEEGKLFISIHKEKEELVLIVKDNGKGLKEEFSELSDTTLGLKLINAIVEYQLFGSLDYEYDNGSKFIVKGEIIKFISSEKL